MILFILALLLLIKNHMETVHSIDLASVLDYITDWRHS